jgi:ferredoxin
MGKVTLDSDKCIGCGTCVALCPANYEMAGAKAKVKSEKDTGCAKQGADNCPVNAIKIK